MTGSTDHAQLPNSELDELTALAARRFDVEAIVIQLLGGQRLTAAEYGALAGLPLAFLGHLVSRLPGRARSVSISAIHPVHLLPLAEWFEEHGSAETIRMAEESIQMIERSLDERLSVSIAIDRWTGKFLLPDLLQVLREIRRPERQEIRTVTRSLSLIGPSTAEIASLQQERASIVGELEALSNLLLELKSYGIDSIDGGTSIELHAFAAKRGFRCSVGHDISAVVETAVHDPRGTIVIGGGRQTAIDERFLLELLDIHTRIGDTGGLAVWFPWFRSALERFHDTTDEALGTPLLRAIALARLTLPLATKIRAPISLVGRNLATLVTTFGADDLGFAATDAHTAKELGLARLSDIAPLFGEASFFPAITL